MSLKALNWVVALAVVTGAAACNREEPQQTAENAATQATGTVDDGRLTTSVQAKYYGDDAVRGRNINVDAENGVVTLRGTVESESAKQRAVALAREVEGVTRVDDQLTVDTALASAREPGGVATTGRGPEAYETRTAERRMEDYDVNSTQPGWITTKIQAQYFANTEVNPLKIDVTTTHNGVVTLEGEVEDANDKAEAVRIARETEGVTRVEDKLRVRGEADTDTKTTEGVERPDMWLTTKVQSKYFLDDDVKGHEINVDTQNGVVTLNGMVENEAQKRRAVALARNTEGVRDVVDRLQVSPNDDADENERTGERAAATADRTADRTGKQIERVDDLRRPDPWITMKVQAQYFLDAEVKGHEINVDTRDGVVTLKGTVDDDAAKRMAEQIARDTEGVKRVVNQLKVGNTQ